MDVKGAEMLVAEQKFLPPVLKKSREITLVEVWAQKELNSSTYDHLRQKQAVA